MKKISFATSLILILLFTSSFLCPADWYLLDTKTFSLQFPKKPETQETTQQSAVGELKLVISIYEGDKDNDENYVYGIITSDYPDSLINSDKKDILEKVFRGSIDGAVGNVQGKLLKESVIEKNGFPGREITVDFKDGMAIILMRMYLVHNRMYILQTITETSKASNASVVKFFNSFILK